MNKLILCLVITAIAGVSCGPFGRHSQEDDFFSGGFGDSDRSFGGFGNKGFSSVFGRGRGRPSFGHSFKDFLARRDAIKAAQKNRNLLQARDKAAKREKLGYEASQGDRFSADRNHKEEEYSNEEKFSNFDSDNQIQYGHNKEVHVVDNVKFGQKKRVSDNSGSKHSSGAKVISQESVDKEQVANESLDTLGEAYKNRGLKVGSNNEHLVDAESEVEKKTEESSYPRFE